MTAIVEEIIADRINTAEKIEDLAFILMHLLKQNSVDEDGTLLTIRALVSFADGLRIEIYPNEHPPPHFHVRSAGMNVSFSLEDCTLLDGTIGGRERKIVQWFHQRSRVKLVSFWNATRPRDCPVGPIPVVDTTPHEKSHA